MREVLNYVKWLRYINVSLIVIYSVALSILTIVFVILSKFSEYFLFVDLYASFHGEEFGLFDVVKSVFLRRILIIVVQIVFIYIPTIVFIVSSSEFIRIANIGVYTGEKAKPEMLHQSFMKLRSYAKKTVYLQVIGFVINIALIIVKIVSTLQNESNDEMFFLFFLSALGLVIILGIIFSLVFPLNKILNLSKNNEFMIESQNNNLDNYSVWKN